MSLSSSFSELGSIVLTFSDVFLYNLRSCYKLLSHYYYFTCTGYNIIIHTFTPEIHTHTHMNTWKSNFVLKIYVSRHKMNNSYIICNENWKSNNITYIIRTMILKKINLFIFYVHNTSMITGMTVNFIGQKKILFLNSEEPADVSTICKIPQILAIVSCIS